MLLRVHAASVPASRGRSANQNPHGVRRQAERDAAFAWNRGCHATQRRCRRSALPAQSKVSNHGPCLHHGPHSPHQGKNHAKNVHFPSGTHRNERKNLCTRSMNPAHLFRSYRPGKILFGRIPSPSGWAITVRAYSPRKTIWKQRKTGKNKPKQDSTNRDNFHSEGRVPRVPISL